MEISKVNLIFSMDEMDGKGEINVLEVAEVLCSISRKLPAEQVVFAAQWRRHYQAGQFWSRPITRLD